MVLRPLHSHRSFGFVASCLAAVALAACAPADGGLTGSGGSNGNGGSNGSGGSNDNSGGSNGSGGSNDNSGGSNGSGGSNDSSGGSKGSGGLTGSGGVTGSGGLVSSSGGVTGSGGLVATGGATGTGGAKGGTTGSGGVSGTGGAATGLAGAKGTGGGAAGAKGTGGATGSGGSASTGSDGGAVNCSATLPSGGTVQNGPSNQGTAAGLSWSLWQNGSGGTITTFPTPAFSAMWTGNSGDFLARTGLEWGSGKAYTSVGTVIADFVETKTATSNPPYSYVGIYGWSVNPCIEWYIVDDSFGKMPVNPGSGTSKGTAMIDGGTYNLLLRPTTGTGGNRCGNVSSWNQFYSIRTTARTCGQISISDHWTAWANAGMTLGSVLEASILIESGGGAGNISFPVANVTAM
jgi:endo-1,4-beta-xylanase